jgi:hypothetical protein
VLEHAFVSESASAVILNDPETDMYGIGAGWKGPLDHLGKYLRGELPDAPATEWYEMPPQDEELAKQRGHAWAAVVAAADTASRE